MSEVLEPAPYEVLVASLHHTRKEIAVWTGTKWERQPSAFGQRAPRLLASDIVQIIRKIERK